MALPLKQFQVVGLPKNIDFLNRIVMSELFSAGDLNTGLTERHHDTLFHAIDGTKNAGASSTGGSTSGRADSEQPELLREMITFDRRRACRTHAFVVLIGVKRVKGRMFNDDDVFMCLTRGRR